MVVHTQSPGAVRTTREQIVAAVDSLPPLPAVAFRVVAAVQDPDSSAAQLSSIIAADPGLTARLLRIANSAAYRRAKEITSVQEALVMLGFVQACNIAVASAIAGSYPPDPGNALFRIDSFWRHSLAVAFRASEIASARKQIDPPTAFTAGVLHNIGRLAIYRAAPADLDQAVARAIREDVPLEEVEHEELGYDHAEIGGMLAERWGLPGEIQNAIANHHAQPQASPLAELVANADRFVVEHGILPGYIATALATLPPQPPEMSRLLKHVDELIHQISGAPQVKISYS